MIFIVAVSFGILIFFLNKVRRECREALAATNAYCDAGDEFMDWSLRNPGVYIGLSEEGRMLLAKTIEGYDWFLRTHTFYHDDGHRDWLVSLFNDLPPKYPDEKDSAEGAQTGALFFLNKAQSSNLPAQTIFILKCFMYTQRQYFLKRWNVTRREFRFLATLLIFGIILALLPIFGGRSANAGNNKRWLVAEKGGNYDAIRGVCDEKTGNLLYETDGRYVSIITVVPGGCGGPLRQTPLIYQAQSLAPIPISISVSAPTPTPTAIPNK